MTTTTANRRTQRAAELRLYELRRECRAELNTSLQHRDDDSVVGLLALSLLSAAHGLLASYRAMVDTGWPRRAAAIEAIAIHQSAQRFACETAAELIGGAAAGEYEARA